VHAMRVRDSLIQRRHVARCHPFLSAASRLSPRGSGRRIVLAAATRTLARLRLPRELRTVAVAVAPSTLPAAAASHQPPRCQPPAASRPSASPHRVAPPRRPTIPSPLLTHLSPRSCHTPPSQPPPPQPPPPPPPPPPQPPPPPPQPSPSQRGRHFCDLRRPLPRLRRAVGLQRQRGCLALARQPRDHEAVDLVRDGRRAELARHEREGALDVGELESR
jgi:hypothetical protein